MKKYKLIKKYPRSPKLGTILTFGKGWGDTEQWIKDYPEEAKEFWKEIIELNFEVINFKLKGVLITFSCPFDMNLLSVYLDTDYEINSIKRLSDNEVFSVGDRTKWDWIDCASNKYLTIDSFILEDNNLIFSFKEIGKSTFPCLKYPDLKHYKEPLFTTEDGYDIFDEKELLWDTSDNVPTFLDTTPAKWFSETVYCENSNFKYRKAWKLEENALIYTEENKPKFSKKDIKEAVSKCNMSTSIGNFIKEEDLFNNLNI